MNHYSTHVSIEVVHALLLLGLIGEIKRSLMYSQPFWLRCLNTPHQQRNLRSQLVSLLLLLLDRLDGGGAARTRDGEVRH